MHTASSRVLNTTTSADSTATAADEFIEFVLDLFDLADDAVDSADETNQPEPEPRLVNLVNIDPSLLVELQSTPEGRNSLAVNAHAIGLSKFTSFADETLNAPITEDGIGANGERIFSSDGAIGLNNDDAQSFVAVDVNGDGVFDVVYVTENGQTFAINGEDEDENLISVLAPDGPPEVVPTAAAVGGSNGALATNEFGGQDLVSGINLLDFVNVQEKEGPIVELLD